MAEIITELPKELEEYQQLEPSKAFLIDNLQDLPSPIIINIFNQIYDECERGFQFYSRHLDFEDLSQFFIELRNIYSNYHAIEIATTEKTAYYVGDTHGAIEESFRLIKYFLPKLKSGFSAKIVFLGDYVDRNPYDLENLCLICAFSAIFPNQVKLIRGNHEDQQINQYYGFLDNLLRNYHEQGDNLHLKVLEFFKLLPIVNILEFSNDGKTEARVMAVHGGIPIDFHDFMNPLLLDELEAKMNNKVSNSEDMDEYTQCMLWSDPDENIQGILTGAHLQGRMRFGFPVFEQFMKANKIHIVVRGHQKWTNGYKIFFGGRLYSLFSTASYDGRRQFDPKILKLTIGNSPEIIPIDNNFLDD